MKSDPWDYELVVDADDSIERVVSDLWYTDDPFFRPRERNFNEIRYLALHIRVPSEMIRRVIRRGVDNCYRRHYLEKPTGEKRVLLEPVDDLKIIQQKIQRRLLRGTEYPASHGFVRNHSIITNAKAHLESTCLLALDLRKAFDSVTRAQVAKSLWGVNLGSKEFGAPQIGLRTAVLIAQLCTVRSEASVYWEPTLPQGAPSSPGLFNLVCFRMDQRLARFATLIGATYTRYADNIAFSAKRELTAKEIRVVQNIIVQKCHFDLNEKKTRLMRTDSYGGSLRVPGVRVREGQLGLSKSSRRRFRGALHKAVQDGDTAKAWGILAYLRQIYGAEIPEQILSDSLEGLN